MESINSIHIANKKNPGKPESEYNSNVLSQAYIKYNSKCRSTEYKDEVKLKNTKKLCEK